MTIYVKKNCPKCGEKKDFPLKQVEQALPGASPQPEDIRNAVYVGFTACENCGEAFAAVFGTEPGSAIDERAKPEGDTLRLPPESVGLTLIPKG